MPLKAVFIDLGNTLLYEKPSRFEIYANAARRRGIEVSGDAMQARMRRAHAELPREIEGSFRYTDGWFRAYIERIFHAGLGLPSNDIEALSEELFAQFSRPDTFAQFPGTTELLAELRERGLRLGIVSNWSTRLPRLLAQLDLERRVDFFLCSAIERVEKPDPEIFARALRASGVAPHEALHAGDDVEKDFHGARALGIRPVLVDHARRHTAWDASAGLRVESLDELRRAIADTP